jgi:hypothetical protein
MAHRQDLSYPRVLLIDNFQPSRDVRAAILKEHGVGIRTAETSQRHSFAGNLRRCDETAGSIRLGGRSNYRLQCPCGEVVLGSGYTSASYREEIFADEAHHTFISVLPLPSTVCGKAVWARLSSNCARKSSTGRAESLGSDGVHCHQDRKTITRIHIKKQPAVFDRFGVQWMPVPA